jgi:steroid 5-alpha reductase family enzyme
VGWAKRSALVKWFQKKIVRVLLLAISVTCWAITVGLHFYYFSNNASNADTGKGYTHVIHQFGATAFITTKQHIFNMVLIGMAAFTFLAAGYLQNRFKR